ncbi:hypothetical protein [Streptomyces sp. H39-C1]|uniref:hypothetical protein n=2 Tax=Streptomyces TaxID=1883 RepID=UPI0022AF294E|nr:hypothetical protein [Streptomyces sp. H39-C1]MCZ4095122.1 hypothetical protein [Streptomyces sp. H39-C1]
MNATADDGSPERTGYRRSAGSPRGEARRQELLDSVTEDLAVNGLVDFSLRRAARAAGATHKVLLHHFDGADDLLVQAIVQLWEQRIAKAFADGDVRGVGEGPLRQRRYGVCRLALSGEQRRPRDHGTRRGRYVAPAGVKTIERSAGTVAYTVTGADGPPIVFSGSARHTPGPGTFRRSK